MLSGPPWKPPGARPRTARRHSRARVTSPLHSTWLGVVLGILLGVTFTVCFVTGLVDYLSQHPTGWFHLPAHPADLYRVNEGLHVFTGIATIPLLLAKLWVVWPELLEWPPINNVLHALERLSLIPLVGGSLFLLFTGVLNIDYWYSPMGFSFTNAHFWTAWLVVGALVIHIGAKAATVRTELGSGHALCLRTRRWPRPGAPRFSRETLLGTPNPEGSDAVASSARSWARRDCWWWSPLARPSLPCAGSPCSRRATRPSARRTCRSTRPPSRPVSSGRPPTPGTA